ncbi:hypothetical protein GCM10023257_52080 [Streptomyces hyderabadensis]|uniref:Uncharacterized protein n=1 Tax=Streptomyces hyderabadensis TaxID=598549 RepID=A0ABP9IKW5_9ACTN
MPEVGIGDGTMRMLCLIELHRPEVDDGIRTRNRPIKGSIRCLRTGHPTLCCASRDQVGGGSGFFLQKK